MANPNSTDFLVDAFDELYGIEHQSERASAEAKNNNAYGRASQAYRDKKVSSKMLIAASPKSPVVNRRIWRKRIHNPAVANITDGSLATISVHPKREQRTLTSNVLSGGVWSYPTRKPRTKSLKVCVRAMEIVMISSNQSGRAAASVRLSTAKQMHKANARTPLLASAQFASRWKGIRADVGASAICGLDTAHFLVIYLRAAIAAI